MADDAKLLASLELKFDKFLKQLDQAGKAADKAVKDIESRFEKANPQLGGSVFRGTFFGNLAAQGARELVSFLKDLPEQFKNLAKSADIAKVSMTEAFTVAGLVGGMDNASKLLENIGLQLEKIRQGATDTPLQRLFDANNVAIGKDTVTVTQQLVELLRRATTAQQELAVQSGLATREMVALANSGKTFDDVEGKVVKLNTGFLSLIDLFKQLTLQAEIWGLTLVSWIARASAGLATFLADNARGLARMGANVPDAGGEPASAGRLRQLADAAKDAETALKKAREELEKLQGKAGFIGPPIPGDFGKQGIKIPQGGGEDPKSALQREEDRINKRIKLLEAETETIGKSTFEIERKRAATEALANIESKQGTPATKEQKDAIEALAVSYGRAAEAADEAHKRFQAGVDIARTVGSALSNAFAEAIVEGKKFGEVMNSLVKTLEKAAINAAIGSLFGGQPGGLGNVLGSILKGKASGGPVSGGNPYVVGEQGPEIFVPRGAGQIIPAGITKGALGGYTSAPVFNIDASGADPAAISRLERALVEVNATIESRARRIMYEDRRRRL